MKFNTLTQRAVAVVMTIGLVELPSVSAFADTCTLTQTSYLTSQQIKTLVSSMTVCYPTSAPYENQEYHDGKNIVEQGGNTGTIGAYTIKTKSGNNPAYIAYSYSTAGKPAFNWAVLGPVKTGGNVTMQWCAVDSTGAIIGGGTGTSIAVFVKSGQGVCTGG